MKYLICTMFLILTACGSSDKTYDSDTGYPITQQYGRQIMVDFVDQNCGGNYDLVCEDLYRRFFGDKLIEFYNKPASALKIIDLDPDLASDTKRFEDYVRNY